MAIVRINDFLAQENRGDALRDLLASFVSTIESSPGCLSCRLLRGRDEPDRLVMVEEWRSVEDHQAAVKRIPPSGLQEAMALVAAPPTGSYYHVETDAN